MILKIDEAFSDIDERYLSWIPYKAFEILKKSKESEMFFQQTGGPFLEGRVIRFMVTYSEDEDKLELKRLL